MTARSKPSAAGCDTTDDALFDGRLRLRQPADGYRVAVDPILLAASVPAADGDAVLDVGTGVGAAALCLAQRVPVCRVTGVEVQPDLVALAGENAVLNGLDDRVRFVAGDIASPPADLHPGGFDHVITNPPYLRPAESRMPPSSSKAVATVEHGIGLAAWLRFCGAMVKRRGTVTVIHRADRLDEVLSAMSEISGAIVLYPLWPKAGEDAKRVIVRGTANRGTAMRVAGGLVLHDATGAYTPEADAVLRNAAALKL